MNSIPKSGTHLLLQLIGEFDIPPGEGIPADGEPGAGISC